MEPDIQETLQNQLRDIHLPADISWWPPAIGWWILLSILLLAGILAVWALVREHRRNKYRRLAIEELKQALIRWHSDNGSGKDSAKYVQSANSILKRVLATTDPYAPLNVSGDHWPALLNQYARIPISDSSSQALAYAGYEADPQLDIAVLHKELLNWLKTHRQTRKTSSPEETVVHV